MNNLDLTYLFGLAPEQAIEYFRSKGYQITFDWHEMLDSAHAQAFTVAKAMKLDVLQAIKDSLDNALEKGETFNTWQKQLTPELQKLGWWGKQEILNEATGELRMAQLGSPYRLRTIYEANLQSAYSAGRWQSQFENRAARPYLMLVAVMDSKTRPAHRAYNGLIARIDDPIWRYLYPPNGWRCRCRVRALTGDQAITMVKNGEGVWVKQEMLSFNDVEIPGSGGETGRVAVYRGTDTFGKSYSVSPDLGWSSNPGMDKWQPQLDKYDPAIRSLW
jgi:SPP1 gp7 family putative phage head morphogenesis protein